MCHVTNMLIMFTRAMADKTKAQYSALTTMPQDELWHVSDHDDVDRILVAFPESYTADDSWIVCSSDGGQRGDKRAHKTTTQSESAQLLYV